MSETRERVGLDERVVDQMLDAIESPALVCTGDGTIDAWNDAFGDRTAGNAVLAGVSVEEFVDWADENPLDETLTVGKQVTAPARLNGDGRRYSVTCRPLERDVIVGAVLTFDDDPDSEWSVHEQTVAAAPDTLYTVDTDLRIQQVSEVFEDITKIPAEEVTGERLAYLVELGIINEETLKRARESLEVVFSGDEDIVTFISRSTVLGTTIVAENKISPVRHDGEIVGAVIAVRDVTDRTRTEQALRESTERLRTILDTLPVAMVVVDETGTIDHVQGLDFESVSCESTNLVGTDVERYAGEYNGVVEGCRRALAGNASTKTTTIGDRTLEAFFEPVRTDGEVTGAIATAVDVTDREERECELAATNERLDLALENTGAGVYEWHIGEDRVYWHETTSRLLGLDPGTNYRSQDAFGKRVHPDDRERVLSAIAEAIQSRGELRTEFRLADTADETRWMLTEGEVHYDDGSPDRIVGTVREITDRKERENQLVEREQRLRAVIEGSPDPIAMQDTDGHFQIVNEAMAETTDRSRDALRGALPAEIYDADTVERLEHHRRAVLESESARVVKERLSRANGESERIVQLTVAPHNGPDGDVQGTVTIARDITEIEHQHDELETLTAIQELIQESVRGLTSATTRPEIKRTVCDRLGDSEFYQGVWIGSRDPSRREITADYAAGSAPDYLDSVTFTVDASEQGQGPGGTAYRTGEMQVVRDVRDDPAFEPWREAALDRGYESVAAIPLTHGSTTHGILCVYTDRREPFGERELAGFEVLGEAVGFALSAAQHRRLLETDRMLELEFTVMSAGPFMEATLEHDCRFVLDNAIPASDGRTINYLTVEGADPEVGAEVIQEFDTLESLRRLDGDNGPHFELKWRESIYQYLAEAGARGKRGIIEGGTGTMVVEAPSDVDVRQVTDAMITRFGDVELVAKRERDRTDVPWWRSHGDIGATLTDRQRAILQAAYYSGYYEWPRETDAETLADSLDIASTTLLQHLRKGHGRVLEAMFDT